VACPDIGTGSKYISDCTTTFCTAVANSTWDSTDVRGQCKFICNNISPGFRFSNSNADCTFTTCTAVPNTSWDPTDVRGQCKTITSTSSTSLYSFTSFTFTPAGATGSTGPTSLTAYGTSYPGYGTSNVLSLSGGIQYWTVPETRTYSFTLAGAGSFHTTSFNKDGIKTGYGIVMNASTSLTRGQRIAILVGQRGLNNGDGGGGTFVASVTGVGALSTSTPLFVAGGAGGPGGEYDTYDEGTNNNINGVMSTTGADGKGDNAGTNGGVGPNGGGTAAECCSIADGGAGFTGNGTFNFWPTGSTNNVPKSFKNGGKGGKNGGAGGFGGGAGYGPYNDRVGGGGGGYGGGGSGSTNGSGAGGGGGGSYDVTGVYSGSATNSGQGYVTVTKL